MPIQGFVRARKHQFGRQSAFGTKVAAKRAYPNKGTPDVDLSWTDPDVDTGSIVVTVAPHREKPTLGANLTDPGLAYNNIPKLMCGFFGGGVTPTGGGAAKTWSHTPAAEAPLDDFDPFTYEFGDDVLTDWFQLGDGILTAVEITGPEGGGAVTSTETWLFGSAASTGSTDSPVTGTVPTPDLNVDTDPTYVYLKDLGIYIADDPDYVESNQITDALHTFTLRLSQEVDEKFFANGDQSFDTDGYGRGAVSVELECSWAKTDDTVGVGSEADDWFSDESVDRFVLLRFTSTILAQSPSTFHKWDVRMPMRYYTRAEGDSGGNTMVVLTGHAFLDPNDFDGYFSSEVVNTLAAGDI